MKPREAKSGSLHRVFWAVIFYCSAAGLLGSLVAIVSFPQLATSATWLHFLSLGSGIVFAVAAARRRKLTLDHFHATTDAVWLARAMETDHDAMSDGSDANDD